MENEFIVARDAGFGRVEYLCFEGSGESARISWGADKALALENKLNLDSALWYARRDSLGFAENCGIKGRPYWVIIVDERSPDKQCHWDIVEYVDGKSKQTYRGILDALSEVARQRAELYGNKPKGETVSLKRGGGKKK